MVDYSNKVCEACSADAPKATQSEIEDFLKNNSEWYLSTDVDFPKLKREFKFNNFFATTSTYCLEHHWSL